jgi:alkylation response protein AidB-like acyl-CoA dehydrogenase
VRLVNAFHAWGAKARRGPSGSLETRTATVLGVPALRMLCTDHPVLAHIPAETVPSAKIFTIFEGTSEIQRMIIGRAVIGVDVR